jgi:RNA polymerase sigma-70 factor (sigma-E family)
VRVDVLDRLPCLRTGIEDDSIPAVRDALGGRYLFGMGHQVGQQAIIRGSELGQVRVMIARDHQHVHRSLRVDIPKGDRSGMSRHNRGWYLAGRYATEQAIRHGAILTSTRPTRARTYMVALLRTHGAPPLGCNGPARCWLSVAKRLVTRGPSLAVVGCGGNGSSLDVLSGDPVSQHSRTASEPSDVVTRPTDVTDAWAAGVPLVSTQVETNADRAVTELYSAHYRSLVRLAALLVRDLGTAEEVVQDAFVAMHGGWHRLRDNDKALAYLRQAVVNRSRSVLRHRQVVDRNAPKPAPDMPSAEHGAIALFERSAVIAAMRTLPARQREALVLRFYADMPEAQIAETMGISRGAVKSHTARAMQALRTVLEREA